MRRAGGVVGMTAGIFGVLAALVTLLVGASGSALRADGADTVLDLGWAGLLLSFGCIVLGAVAMGARSRWPGILLIVTALLAAVCGGTFVAVCMVLALAGGVLAAIPGRPRAIVTRVLPGTPHGPAEPSR